MASLSPWVVRRRITWLWAYTGALGLPEQVLSRDIEVTNAFRIFFLGEVGELFGSQDDFVKFFGEVWRPHLGNICGGHRRVRGELSDVCQNSTCLKQLVMSNDASVRRHYIACLFLGSLVF